MGGRKQSYLEPKAGVHIIGEGITEQYYFSHLRTIFNYKCTIKQRFFGHTSIAEIEKKIIELLRGNVCVICVFDADISIRNEKENERLNKLRKKYKNNKNVILCDSLPSIEYWFLLHYVDTCPNYLNSGQVERALKSYITEYDKCEDYLKKEKWVKDMSLEQGSLSNAKERAEKYCNSERSYSNLYLAFKQLQ